MLTLVSPSRSLAAKLALGLLLACVAVFALILLDVHRWTRAMLLAQIQREGDAVIAGVAARIDGELLRVEEAPRRLAQAVGQQRPARTELERDLCVIVAANSTVFGSAAAFEPGEFAPGVDAFSPYCYREGPALRVKDLAPEATTTRAATGTAFRANAGSRSGRSRTSTKAAAGS